MYFIVRCGQSTVGIPAKTREDAKNRAFRIMRAASEIDPSKPCGPVHVLGACHPALGPTLIGANVKTPEDFRRMRDLAWSLVGNA